MDMLLFTPRPFKSQAALGCRRASANFVGNELAGWQWLRWGAVCVGILSCCMLLGCASTTVTRHPGPNDCGVRYYRPKPYLLLTAADGNAVDQVEIKLEYLPDFSEEYAIHIRSGLGANKTKITLDQGWNLTKIDYDVDSKVPENIEAVADLIDKVGGVLPTAEKQSRVTVKASNVPLGYYEAVIGCGPSGGKQLFGWRYVGFLPYAQCPTEMGGFACSDCQSETIYALVFDNGVMTFKSLDAAATTRSEVTAATNQTGSSATSFGGEKFQLELIKALRSQLRAELTPDDVRLRWDGAQCVVSIRVTPDLWTRLTSDSGIQNSASAATNPVGAWKAEVVSVCQNTAKKFWAEASPPAAWAVEFNVE
jgi:hypothetical protein